MKFIRVNDAIISLENIRSIKVVQGISVTNKIEYSIQFSYANPSSHEFIPFYDKEKCLSTFNKICDELVKIPLDKTDSI